MIKSKQALIDQSADNNNSLGVQAEGMLLCAIQFPAAMTGSAVTFDFALDNSVHGQMLKKQTELMLLIQFQQEML